MALNVKSYFIAVCLYEINFISFPYTFVEMHPSKEAVATSRLGTQCYVISNLFICIGIRIFWTFPTDLCVPVHHPWNADVVASTKNKTLPRNSVIPYNLWENA